ncbi:N-acetylmuramoyl-L-alanine amidase [Candidatus Syntrophocurvum alkaliphilum]|uniref:N-acetylmuramoyl-L-alanine amidase n=1 Tax=Candidatus Syntrophocurvum alkaliphilum TaxID=2293317 RepID=A0A6I6DM65_9FIRM|nr:N-acetylmuramoyl-L-alanine amidase [Candidatus Syntrophocurvum alkaliphilum]QGU00837.1 N-acetylmuramoyl-L-alanine amidase [Candidatus Syntrophocurvum alkaliphilum]
MIKVGIDPGHGGSDSGAVGVRGYREKDIVLSIAKEVESHLKQNSIKTVMTRTEDKYVSLNERTRILNDSKVDICLSIHANASTNRDADYISTFIYTARGEAESLAYLIQKEMVNELGWQDGGVRIKNLHILRETNMPAILLECGFITNLKQERKLIQQDTKKNLAKAMVAGILSHYNLAQNTKPQNSDLPSNNKDEINQKIKEFENNLLNKKRETAEKNETIKRILNLAEKSLQ